MKEDFYYLELFEIYKGLLTEKQREMFYSHYFLDLSYAEIAETEGTMRQSVFDAIKKVKLKLNEFESALKIKSKNDKLIELSNTTNDSETSAKLLEIIGG